MKQLSSTRYLKAFTVVFLAIFILWFVPVGLQQKAFAQAWQPIFAGPFARNLSWSTDSQLLLFQSHDAELGPQVTDQSWYHYAVLTGGLTTSNTLQVALSGR